ncbi:uncharacterized protein [Dermacentor albipictus]|uniref:uncharacterized protein isoform X5 n=1 Tax=Dermacentor albipictus TaxID=60249 RepID=UPI0038FD007D
MTALTAVASSVASSYCSKARTLKFRGGAQSPKGTGAWCKISLPPSRTQPEPVSLGWLNLSGHLNLITANESTSTPSLPLHRQAVRKSKTPPGARRLRLTNVVQVAWWNPPHRSFQCKHASEVPFQAPYCIAIRRAPATPRTW